MISKTPDERPAGLVVIANEGLDLLQEFLDAAEGTASNDALRDYAEPSLHLIQPRRKSGREVNLVAGRCASNVRTFGCLWVA